MSAVDSQLTSKVQRLDDLSLALLLSIIANEHCIVEVPDEWIEATQERIILIARNVFALSAASVYCSRATTLDEFRNTLIIGSDQTDKGGLSAGLSRTESYDGGHHTGLPNVIIATNLGDASTLIQTQALELIRTRRIYTHTDVYSAPKPFAVITLCSTSATRLSEHLNDLFFISTYHDPNDSGLQSNAVDVTLKGKAVSNCRYDTEDKSALSDKDVISAEDIESLIKLRTDATMTVEVRRYLHDVVVFLRMHRAVGSGTTPKATKYFELLAQCLAPCNGLTYVPPSLVALASRKIYRHRIQLVTVEQERSMQYGSDPALVAAALRGLTPDLIIDEVLDAIEVPV